MRLGEIYKVIKVRALCCITLTQTPSAAQLLLVTPTQTGVLCVFMQEAVDEQACVTPSLQECIDKKQYIYVGEDGPPNY
jgi:hypothetical protein